MSPVLLRAARLCYVFAKDLSMRRCAEPVKGSWAHAFVVAKPPRQVGAPWLKFIMVQHVG
jgi:hypothetical protein